MLWLYYINITVDVFNRAMCYLLVITSQVLFQMAFTWIVVILTRTYEIGTTIRVL